MNERTPAPTSEGWIEFCRYTAWMRARGWRQPFVWRRRTVLPVGVPGPVWIERTPHNDNAAKAT